MELSITYNYIHIGQTCRLHTTTLRSDMSIVYKKSQRISNNIISCHHIVNLYYPREVCCILPSHDIVTFSCILLSHYCHWTILIVTLLSHYIFTLCLSRLSYALLTLCHIRLTLAILTLWRTQLSYALLT